MTEKIAEQTNMEDLGTCTTGSKTEEPCPRPAVKMWGRSALCKEHLQEATVQTQSDDLTLSLELLTAFIYEARGHHARALAEDLERVQAGLQERLSDTDGFLGMLTRAADSHKSGA
jgi:hypothetical protein